VRKPATIFFCSDFLAPDVEALRRLTDRHDVVAVTLSDRSELALPALGLVAFLDPETGDSSVVDTSDPNVQAFYQERGLERRRKRQGTFHALGIDELQLFTHESFLRPLFAFFRRRGQRRVRRHTR
jgi:hypothetical protein